MLLSLFVPSRNSPFNRNDKFKLSSCVRVTRETVVTGRRIRSLLHENESVALQPTKVCLVNANIQQKEKTWPRLWKQCGSESRRVMFSLTSGVQISPQKKKAVCARLCASVWVCVMSSKVTAVGGGGTNSVLENDLCRATSCENPTTLKRFPFHLDWIQKKHQHIQKVHLKLPLRWLSQCWHFSGFSLIMWSQWWVVTKFSNLSPHTKFISNRTKISTVYHLRTKMVSAVQYPHSLRIPLLLPCIKSSIQSFYTVWTN